MMGSGTRRYDRGSCCPPWTVKLPAPGGSGIWLPPALATVAPMRLTDYTDYSLRALIYVALNPDELVTIQNIAEAFSIPKNHLVKIVQRLGQAGLLHTVRGRMGGVRLGKPAAEINI